MDETPTPPPAGPDDYGAPEMPEGMMLTPAGLEDCLGDGDVIGEHTTPVDIPLGQTNGTQATGGEDEGWTLWEPCLAKHYDPPPQRWAVDGFFPQNDVSLFTGDGDLGKSTMLQQLQVACALTQPWLGMEVTKGPTLGIYCEDGEPQVWRRFKRQCSP